MESDELVLVAEFDSGDEAQVAHALMKSAGIPSFLMSESTYAPDPNWAYEGGDGVVLLMVSPLCLAQAREILDSQISEEDLIAQAEAAALPPESAAVENANDDPLAKKS
jgi:hypothetical protein